MTPQLITVMALVAAIAFAGVAAFTFKIEDGIQRRDARRRLRMRVRINRYGYRTRR